MATTTRKPAWDREAMASRLPGSGFRVRSVYMQGVRVVLHSPCVVSTFSTIYSTGYSLSCMCVVLLFPEDQVLRDATVAIVVVNPDTSTVDFSRAILQYKRKGAALFE